MPAWQVVTLARQTLGGPVMTVTHEPPRLNWIGSRISATS
jgi:hypothetical protein